MLVCLSERNTNFSFRIPNVKTRESTAPHRRPFCPWFHSRNRKIQKLFSTVLTKLRIIQIECKFRAAAFEFSRVLLTAFYIIFRQLPPLTPLLPSPSLTSPLSLLFPLLLRLLPPSHSSFTFSLTNFPPLTPLSPSPSLTFPLSLLLLLLLRQLPLLHYIHLLHFLLPYIFLSFSSPPCLLHLLFEEAGKEASLPSSSFPWSLPSSSLPSSFFLLTDVCNQIIADSNS